MNIQYKCYTVYTDIEIVDIYDLSIREEINMHTQLFLQGSYLENQSDDAVIKTSRKSKIEVRDLDNVIVFCGWIKDISMTTEKNVYTFELYAVSSTFELDIKKKKRTFQDLAMTYKDVLNEILRDYPNAVFLDTLTNNIKIPHLLVQYNETDWEFIKRLASHFNGVLCVRAKTHYPQFFFGFPSFPKEHEIKEHNYLITKDLEKYIKTARNYQKKIDHWEEMIYSIETYDKFNLCEEVIYKKKNLVITKLERMVKKEEEVYQYTFAPKKSAQLNYKENKNIRGARLFAVIKEVKRNSARLYFDIDKGYTGTHYPFFSYSGGENNELGYYMSIPGSRVEVYFPDAEEGSSFICASVRQENQVDYPQDDPREKYICNENKKKIQIGYKNLEFTTGNDDIQITMTKDGITTIHSSKTIKIDAGRNIEIGTQEAFCTEASWVSLKNAEVKTISISAENKIRFQVDHTGNNYMEMNENANIICKASENVFRKGEKGKKENLEIDRPALSKTDLETLRRNVISLSGTEFISQGISGNTDFEKPKQIVSDILNLKPNNSTENSAQLKEYNPIRDELLNKDEKLFKMFSYGESVNGNEK